MKHLPGEQTDTLFYDTHYDVIASRKGLTNEI